MRKIINPWLNKPGYNCFGCSPDNPMGLHLHFYEDGDDIVSYWKPKDYLQGWVGILHGGIIATLVDEVAGWVVTRKLQTSGMTSQLQVRYKKPVKVDEPVLCIRAHVKDRKNRLVWIDASIANDRGEVCVEAELIYYAMPPERAKEMGFEHCEVDDEELLSFE